jgi:hypothetical protein
MCRIMVIRSPCVGMTRPAAGRGGSERAVQEAQAALGGHADPDRAGDAERGAGAHGDGVLGEPADQRVLVWGCGAAPGGRPPGGAVRRVSGGVMPAVASCGRMPSPG